MLTTLDDGLMTFKRPIEVNPERAESPEIPFPWPPAGPPVRYCTIEESGSSDIYLTDQKGQVVCTLARICIDFRAHLTNIDNSVTRVTIASSTRIFARHSQWIKDSDDPASWTPEITLNQLFYDFGHFDDPAHEHKIPLGRTDRVCGRDVWFKPASWPGAYSDVKPEHLWMDDPLPTFDSRGYLQYTWDPRLSGYCGP